MFLSEVIRNFDWKLSQEQTWAVCHVTAKYLATKRRENMVKRRRVRFDISAETVQLTEVGSVEITMKEEIKQKQTEYEILFSIGNLLSQCLNSDKHDILLLRRKNCEPELIDLISGLIDQKFDEYDEGYEADFASDVASRQEGNGIRKFRSLEQMCRYCEERLRLKNIPSGSKHYQNVVKALYYESFELKSFLDHVTTSLSLASEITEGRNLNPSVANTAQECVYEWARFWLQVMHELRRGVHLKKVTQTKISPEEYELLPRELVFDSEVSTAITSKPDERSKLPGNAREIILDFLTSKPGDQRGTALQPCVEENSDWVDQGEVEEIMINETKGSNHRKSLKVESPLWDKVNNWDASLESLLSDEKCHNCDENRAVSPLSGDLEEDFASRRNSVDLGKNSPKRTSSVRRRLSANLSYEISSDSYIEEDSPALNVDPNGNTALMSKKRLAVSTICLTEVELQEDHRAVGLSLYEISKTRKAIAKAEAELLPLSDPKSKAVRNGTVCFACRKAKFSFFSRAAICYVCSNKFCSKCIVDNIEIPNHLVDTKSRGVERGRSDFASSKTFSKSLSDLVTCVGQDSITPFPCKRPTLLQLGSKRVYGGKVTSVCPECKIFIESIITETKNLRWHVGMAIDI